MRLPKSQKIGPVLPVQTFFYQMAEPILLGHNIITVSYLQKLLISSLLTAKEVWGKVMFSQVFVCPWGGCGERAVVKGGVVKGIECVVKEVCGRHLPGPRGRHPLPPNHDRDGHRIGRYPSYWNAFLFLGRNY